MTCKSLETLAVSLESLLNNINDHCTYISNKGQPLGLCIVSPKQAFTDRPTSAIQDEIENRAIEYFKGTCVEVCCFRYFVPPLFPLVEGQTIQKTDTIDDYQVFFEHPQIDPRWQQTEIARSLIYCPHDPAAHEWSDWFELQQEAIRLTPILDQTLEECQIMHNINCKLGLSAKPIFESFVYEYAKSDLNFPEMSKSEKEAWNKKEVDWTIRYRLAVDVIKPAKTLHDLYIIARRKAASSRNLVLKPLFLGFVEHVERYLVQITELPKEKKKRLLLQLRRTKKRESKGKYIAKKPAVCISDVECAQVLYLLIQDFLKPEKRTEALAEAIIFIWLAQHGAFSGLHLTVDNILSIRFADINFHNLTISIKYKEINLTDGLNEILSGWIGDVSGRGQQLLLENITYDSLEDIISKVSTDFYGILGRLSPRDFLEKVHVIPGVRITLELRRQITAQEPLVKNSPYRANTSYIKKNIKQAVRNRAVAVE